MLETAEEKEMARNLCHNLPVVLVPLGITQENWNCQTQFPEDYEF